MGSKDMQFLPKTQLFYRENMQFKLKIRLFYLKKWFASQTEIERLNIN
jgi:hypothetical protein